MVKEITLPFTQETLIKIKSALFTLCILSGLFVLIVSIYLGYFSPDRSPLWILVMAGGLYFTCLSIWISVPKIIDFHEKHRIIFKYKKDEDKEE